ncbi:MAG TPA: type II toxin-antitoxin system RelE/ParE family toxin [Candidatus Acidoferrum sp.]|nr:type II toxin-antitoxin system RelE/ParE family toxin [Candidatus Acidoferrum sp.]
MIRVLRRSDHFWADALKQIDWYRENASPEVAEGYVNALEATLQALAKTPGLGRPRFQSWPELAGIRSWRIERPFHRHLIFYRFDKEILMAERVLHGARDLPRRLLQSPYEDG